MKSLALEGSHIVGGFGAVEGPSPFAWAKPVLRHDNDLLLVHRYTPNGAPEGDLLRETEWTDALARGEAFQLGQDAEALPNGMLWLFRPSFSELLPGVHVVDELGEYALGPLDVSGSTCVMLVDERRADTHRNTWRQVSFRTAWDVGRQGDWTQARRYADLAFLLTPGFDAVSFAFLHLATEKAGDLERAAWELDVALRSCGPAFVAGALRLREALWADLAAQQAGVFVFQPLDLQLKEIRERFKSDDPSARVLLDAVLTIAYLERSAGVLVGANLVSRGLEKEGQEWLTRNRWPELANGLALREIADWVTERYQQALSDGAVGLLGLSQPVNDDLEATDLLLSLGQRFPHRPFLLPLGILVRRLDERIRVAGVSLKEARPYACKTIQMVRHIAKVRGGWTETSVLDLDSLLVASVKANLLDELNDNDRRAITDVIRKALESPLTRARTVVAAANGLGTLSVAGHATITWEELRDAAVRVLALAQTPFHEYMYKTASRTLLEAVRRAPVAERAEMVKKIESLSSLAPEDYAVRLHLLDACADMAADARNEDEWQHWWDSALAHAEVLKKLNPTGAPGYLRRARLLDEAGRVLEAAEELDILGEIGCNGDAQYVAVELLIREELWPEVGDRLTHLLVQQQPNHHQAARWLAEAPEHLAADQANRLKDRFRQAVGSNPTRAQNYVLRLWNEGVRSENYQDAEEKLKETLRDGLVTDAETLLGSEVLHDLSPARRSFYHGTIALVKKDVRSAYVHYLTSFDSAPTPGAADRLAYCAMRLGRYDDAENRLRQLLQRKPNDGSALFLLGLVQLVKPKDDQSQKAVRVDTARLWVRAIEAHVDRMLRLDDDVARKHFGLALRTAVRLGYLVAEDSERLVKTVVSKLDQSHATLGAVVLDGLERSRCFSNEVASAVVNQCRAERPLATSFRALHYAMGRGFLLAADRGLEDAEKWFQTVLQGFDAADPTTRLRLYAELLAGGKRTVSATLRRWAAGDSDNQWLRNERRMPAKYEQLCQWLTETRDQSSYYRKAHEEVVRLRLSREETCALAVVVVQRTARLQVQGAEANGRDHLLDALPLALAWKEAEVWRQVAGSEWADSFDVRRVRLWLDEADWRRATREPSPLHLTVGDSVIVKSSNRMVAGVRLSPWLVRAIDGTYEFFPDVAFSSPEHTRLPEPDPEPALTSA